ncbi:MAG: hypothetical protein J6B33_06310 [Prevotella sp.]|nr:hypothetical protein [Prevotella sp.]
MQLFNIIFLISPNIRSIYRDKEENTGHINKENIAIFTNEGYNHCKKRCNTSHTTVGTASSCNNKALAIQIIARSRAYSIKIPPARKADGIIILFFYVEN